MESGAAAGDAHVRFSGTASTVTSMTRGDTTGSFTASELQMFQEAKDIIGATSSDYNCALAPRVTEQTTSQGVQGHSSGTAVDASAAGVTVRKRKAEETDHAVGQSKAPCQDTDLSLGAVRGGDPEPPTPASDTEEDIRDNLYKRVFEGAGLSEVQQVLSTMDEATLHEKVPFAIYAYVAGGHKPNEVLEELLAAVHNQAARPAVNIALGFAAEFGLFDTFKLLYSRYGFTSLDTEEAASDLVGDHSWLHGVPYHRPPIVIRGVLLQLAIESGSYDLVQLLLDDGALADQVNELGNLPLNVAAKEGNTHIMSLLLAKGADIRARDASDRTAMDLAAEFGHRPAVELLLQLHVPEAVALAPALQSALRSGHADIAALFLALDTMHTFDPLVYDTYNPVIAVVLARDMRSLQVLLSNYASHASLASLDGASKAQLDDVFSIVSASLHLLIEVGLKQGTVVENNARSTILEALVKDVARNLVGLWWEAVLDYSNSPRLLDVIAACESTRSSIALLLNADTELESVLAAAFAKHYEEDSEADSGSEAASSCLTGSEADMEQGAAVDAEELDSDSAHDSGAESESAGDSEARHLLWCIGEGSTVLHELVRLGELVTVQHLLDAGASVDAIDIDRHTPLHVAAASGDAEIVKLLVEAGASVNAATIVGTTPLMMAAGAAVIAVEYNFGKQYFPSKPDALQALLQRDADLAAVSILGWTALHYAVAIDCAMAVDVLSKAMLEAESEVDVHDVAGYTPLHLAAMLGHTKVADLLLNVRAKVASATKSSGTPYLDVPTRHYYQLNVLDPPLDQWQPLHIAAYFGHVDMVELLLQHGAPVDAASGDGKSALHLAIREGQHEVAELLLLRGAVISDGEGPAPTTL